jgi:hypothetical protein
MDEGKQTRFHVRRLLHEGDDERFEEGNVDVRAGRVVKFVEKLNRNSARQ